MIDVRLHDFCESQCNAPSSGDHGGFCGRCSWSVGPGGGAIIVDAAGMMTLPTGSSATQLPSGAIATLAANDVNATFVGSGVVHLPNGEGSISVGSEGGAISVDATGMVTLPTGSAAT